MPTRIRFATLAAAVLTLAIVTPTAAVGGSTTGDATADGAIHVPATWGPQALGWGDLMWFRSSTRTASCLALKRDGWTILANLSWLHRLVVAAPHPSGSVAAKARARLLKDWHHFAVDARSFINAGKQCPTTLAGRDRLARRIVGTPQTDQPPAWANRLFELFAVLYQRPTAASCAALTAKVAAAQHDLARGLAHARYFGRAPMTTRPGRWQSLLQTGATCIVSQGGEMETGVAWGIATLLGAARAERFHDRPARAAIRKGFST